MSKKDAAATARIANALTEAGRQGVEPMRRAHDELRAVHGHSAVAAAYERMSGSLAKPPADWN
jgi:hypothetical protein